jgi:hypothetical protein
MQGVYPALLWRFKMRTIPIDNCVDFRALEAYANAALSAKGYALQPRKGSTSWTDPRIKPVDAAVRFKLCRYPRGIFFGARQEWAVSQGIPLVSIGSLSETVLPSPVLFRGDYVENDAAGRLRIGAIVDLVTSQTQGIAPKASAVNGVQAGLSAQAVASGLAAGSLQPPPFEPQDEWERRLLQMASNCGVSLSNTAVSSEGIYD